MKQEIKTIEINGATYALVGETVVEPLSNYSLVRCASSGILFGIVEKQEGQTVVLRNARQLWYWKTNGLNVLDIAVEGILSGSKITHEVPSITLTDAICVVPCTEKAAMSIVEAKTCIP